MQIITAPHPTLRQVARQVTQFDKKFWQFADELADTLLKKEHPRGVGLAAPQVDKSWQMFAAVLGEQNQESDKPNIEIFVNPRITKHGPLAKIKLKDKNLRYEGCLSIPLIYGPVPRYSFVELEYQSASLARRTVVDKKARFDAFDAQVVQHEYDHLQGILFTDHSLRLDLPVFIIENEQWVEISNKKEILSLL